MAIINTPHLQMSPESTVATVKGITTRLYQTIKREHTQAFKAVWENPKFTAKEIVDALGTDALELFQLSSALQTILETADPGYGRLQPPLNFTANIDGTVLVEEK